MIIDFHTHIFPDKIAASTIEALEAKAGLTASTDGTLNGLLASMEAAGVDMSVILPVVTKPSQFETVNAFAASVNGQYKGKLLSFGGIHPDTEDYKGELNRIKELGLKGIKIHPDYQGVMIDDVRYMNIIEYADSLDLIILTHAGIDIGLPDPVHCPPDRMRKVMDKLHPQKMVVAHFGGWNQWEEVYEYLAGENLYLDTAFSFPYIKEDMFYNILKKHGTDRVLFATDCPWGYQKKDVESLRKLDLTEEVKECIFYKNAKKLLEI